MSDGQGVDARWGLAVIAIGLFAAAGGVYNWGWFMNNSRARLVSMLLTRAGARIFYVVLGLGLVIVGVLVLLGVG
ncbi:MAG: Imm17 family immunity protein [Candidatus Rokuibacteriota bacterium]